MVSTLDSESSDPSSRLGGTYDVFFMHILPFFLYMGTFGVCTCTV